MIIHLINFVKLDFKNLVVDLQIYSGNKLLIEFKNVKIVINDPKNISINFGKFGHLQVLEYSLIYKWVYVITYIRIDGIYQCRLTGIK